MNTAATYDCQLQSHAPLNVMVIRTRTRVEELPPVMGKAYAAIAQYLTQLGQAPSGPPFAAYYNQDMTALDLEIGFVVADPMPGKNEIQPGEISAGQWAVCTVVGPYSGIGQGYDALSNWIAAHDLDPTGVAYEMYLNDPAHTRPEDLRTQIAIPLRTR